MSPSNLPTDKTLSPPAESLMKLCQQGKGRTGTVAAASLLMKCHREEKLPKAEAYKTLVELIARIRSQRDSKQFVSTDVQLKVLINVLKDLLQISCAELFQQAEPLITQLQLTPSQ